MRRKWTNENVEELRQKRKEYTGTTAEFCKEQKLCLSQFYRYMQGKVSKSKKTPSGFLQLPSLSGRMQAIDSRLGDSLEITLPNNISMTVRGASVLPVFERLLQLHI